jgi:ABC-2 type transport system permease protein
MNAFASQFRLGLTLAIRNRMALIYGFIFPLIFLIAFYVLYRHDEVPIALHLGELLTVTILGGACFGLPTTLVSERERGVWRRYRLSPAPTTLFIASTLATRFMLILAAMLLQTGLALALGMPYPAHPLGLLFAFSLTAIAFMGLGLIVAVLSDNVPTVQALGQCIFLPMLIIGGVAVRLSALPPWALQLSTFFPGRYAVAAMQGNVTGSGLTGIGFDLVALGVMGAAALIAGLHWFRWDADSRSAAPGARPAILLALSAWVLVGLMAIWQGRIEAPDTVIENVGSSADFAPESLATGADSRQPSWRSAGADDFKRIAFERLPPDGGLVSPIAAASERPDPLVAERLDHIRTSLASWPPGQESDLVQRTRNYLYIIAVADLLQMSDLERFLPRIVFDQMQGNLGDQDLPRLLYWVAMHPNEGDDAAAGKLELLGLPAVTGPRQALRGRVMLYAFKFLGRLTGDLPTS